jgi:hypothetical protein
MIFACVETRQELRKRRKTSFLEDDTGMMKEYIGNKIDRKDGEIKMTQPVLLQSFMDEFALVRDHKITVPAVLGSVLSASENKLSVEDLFKYHSGTGKLLHLMKWSHPEIGNAVQARVVSIHVQCWNSPSQGDVSCDELLSQHKQAWQGIPSSSFLQARESH